MVGAGDWESLETGSRWRLGVAGDWESLETGLRGAAKSDPHCQMDLYIGPYQTDGRIGNYIKHFAVPRT
jgi:hypothetical protein